MMARSRRRLAWKVQTHPSERGYIPFQLTPQEYKGKVYLYRDIKQILHILLDRGLKTEALRFFEIYRGIHDCATWRLTFPDGLRWIFQDL